MSHPLESMKRSGLPVERQAGVGLARMVPPTESSISRWRWHRRSCGPLSLSHSGPNAKLSGALRFVCAVAVIQVLLGCNARSDFRQQRQAEFEDYGKLPGLSRSDHPELPDELARIAEQRATPEMLSEVDLPDADNAATTMMQVWPPEGVSQLATESELLLPPPGELLIGAALERAAQFRARHHAAQQRIREALRGRDCEFHVDYMRGFAADLSFVDVVIVAARLELFAAAEQLAAGDPAAAIEPIDFAFRLIHYLSHVKLVEPRLQAAFLRSEILEAVAWTVRHDAAPPEILDRLYELIEFQLSAWPPDQQAWVGDRALGMHTYEVIRDGRVRWLLTPEEAELLQQEGVLDQLDEPDVDWLEADEWFYLETMRAMIQACQQPYVTRQEFFENLWSHLQRRRNHADFPLIAARILLKDVENGHQIQASDRARCEAWSLALATAAGRDRPPYEVNPLTGQSYRVVTTETQVSVWNVADVTGGPELPVTVPLPRTIVEPDSAATPIPEGS